MLVREVRINIYYDLLVFYAVRNSTKKHVICRTRRNPLVQQPEKYAKRGLLCYSRKDGAEKHTINKDANMKKSGASDGQPASELISKRIAELGDWRGETLSRMRNLIKEAGPDVVEEWKWMGTPVWSQNGIICTGES